MADFNKRLQVLLTEEQQDFLQELSRKTGKSQGELMRDAFEQVYRPHSSVAELQALRRLLQSPLTEHS